MKVGVFFRNAPRSQVEEILYGLRDNSIAAIAYRIGSTWRELNGAEIFQHFSGITHFVLFVWDGPMSGASKTEPVAVKDTATTEYEYTSSWLAFLTGYSIGRGVPSYVLTGADKTLPPFLSGLHRLHGTDELVGELAQQRVLFEQSSIVERARFELAEEGIGLNDNNLAACVAEGDETAVRNFLRMGFSPNTVNANGVPLLSLAVRRRNSSLVRLLIDEGALVNALAEDRGTSPLMEAAGHGELPYVRLLLERGADLHQKSKTGQNALILAASEGHTDVVGELVKYGPNLDVVDSLGMTALRYAKLFGYQEIVSLLEDATVLDISAAR
ncbi:MAG: ankyrin repeat domain-containing protein [Spirochaetaceae bacterium]|nr:MAG: ankyrin repeat domain-containing protein [Spirochaetaceae bacterium]